MHQATTPASLNATAALFYDHVANGVKANAAGNDFLAKTGSSWIDVRDVAEAHALALQKEAAGGERIIINGGEPTRALAYFWL